jgi:hypothetical protein
MNWNEGSRRLELRSGKNSRMLEHEGVHFRVTVAGGDSSQAVVFRGHPISVKLA